MWLRIRGFTNGAELDSRIASGVGVETSQSDISVNTGGSVNRAMFHMKHRTP